MKHLMLHSQKAANRPPPTFKTKKCIECAVCTTILGAYLAGNLFIQAEPKRGLGQSPNGGLGGQSPPTAQPSYNLAFRCNYCARIMCMLH